MKKLIPLLLCALVLTGCGKKTGETAAETAPGAPELPPEKLVTARVRDADTDRDAAWAKKLPMLPPEPDRLMRRNKYDADGIPVSYLEYRYDAQGCLTEERPCNADGSFRDGEYVYRYTYEYVNGYPVAKNAYDARDRLCYRYKLDEAGREWKWIVYDEGGNIKLWYIDEYDEQGNVLRHTLYEDGRLPVLQNAREYDYNEHGDPTECRYVDLEGNVLNRYTYRYVYDAAGRIVEMEQDDLGANIVQEWYRYTYDDSGRMIARTQIDESGRVNIQDVYEYDAAGRVRFDRIYAASGELAVTLEYLWQ